jgi:hypothetical protein
MFSKFLRRRKYPSTDVYLNLLVTDKLGLPYIHRKERRHFPHIDHKKRIYQQTSRLKKGDIEIVTVLLNRSPSQRFYADSSLYFMGMKLRVRYPFGMCLIVFKLFRISAPKFSESFRRSTAELIS